MADFNEFPKIISREDGVRVTVKTVEEERAILGLPEPEVPLVEIDVKPEQTEAETPKRNGRSKKADAVPEPEVPLVDPQA